MDDPWGSPWAATTDDKAPKPPSPIKSTLEPPPRAFLTSSNSSIPTFSTSSPWDDDDNGFGGFNPSDNASGTSNGTTGWSGWANGDATGSSQQLTPVPRDDGFGRASPIAWPGTVATSPGIKVLSRSNSISTGRQPSPDPWVSEFPFKRGSVASSRRDPSPIRLDEVTVGQTLQLPSITPTKPSFVEDTDAVPNESRPPSTPSSTKKHAEEIALGETQEEHPDWEEGDQRTDQGPIRSRSRPSSSLSDESRPDDRPQDSPITSIDEDSRIRSQTPQRKVSSKVQELVDMYDSMGKRRPTAEESAIRQPQETGDGQLDDEEEADADYGDFEEAEEAAQAEESRVSTPDSGSRSDQASTPTMRLRNKQPIDLESESPKPAGSPTEVRSPSSAVESVFAKFGSIQFSVDLGKVDELFPDAVPGSIPTADKASADSYVPDHVLLDSFTEISERKTWYRISRQGPMRKHDAGADDENYRRVAWPSSAVRDQTIGTVRRWMEEDSFGGRPTLGGGGGGGRGNIFGWDSNAAPVALDEIFGRKRRSTNSKKQSISQPRQPPQPSLCMPPAPPVVNGLTLGGPSITESPVAQFGWNSLGPHANASSAPLQKSGGKPEPKASNQVDAHIVPAPSIAVKEPTPATMPVVVVDDDNDWGEMVSSPQDETGPPLINGFFDSDLAPLKPAQNGIGREMPPPNDLLGNGVAQTTNFSGQSQKPSNMLNAGDSTIPTLDLKLDKLNPVPPSLADPWASADLSFFDSAVLPAASPAVQPKTVDRPKKSNPFSSERKDQNPYATAVASSSQTSTLPPTPTPAARHGGNSKQDALAARVLGSLPDLSYMLR